MAQGGTTATFTSDFRRSYAADTGKLLTKRFLYFGCTMVVINLITWLILLVAVRGDTLAVILYGATGEDVTDGGTGGATFGAPRIIVALLFMALPTVLYAAATIFVWFDKPQAKTVVRISMAVVATDGFIIVLMMAMGVQSATLGGFIFSHVIAALFLPWTPKQAIGTGLIVLGANAVGEFFFYGDTFFNAPITELGDDLLFAILSSAVAVPGTIVAWFKSTRRMQRYKITFLAQRYGEVRRELTDARKIHESLFPAEIKDGPIRLAYEYAPMRQIGGDFLYVCTAPPKGVVGEEGLNVVLIDVTGHGIPAALTVNRLHGELERIFAEDPLASPGEVLSLLNRYVHLTLAPHSIYGTAVCLRVDPEEGTVEYASGGHPPAYIRGVDGSIERLDSTSFVLGACPDEAFDAEPRTHTFGPGDSLLVYSDGVTEARDKDGRMLGITGLEALLAGRAPGRDCAWPEILDQELEAYRDAPPEDDTLVVEVFRPVVTREAKRQAEEAGDGSASRPESAKA